MSTELDIEAIKARHLDPTKNRGRTYYVGHIEVDLAVCVEEIEYLREQLKAKRADSTANDEHIKEKA